MLEVVPFDRRYRRTAFDCGAPDLDTWLKNYAGQSENRDTTRTFLAVEANSGSVIGYHATRTHELSLDDAAAAFGVGKRKYPLPAVLLARLAVDRRYQGQGLGRLLLVDALERVSEVPASVGFEVLVVDDRHRCVDLLPPVRDQRVPGRPAAPLHDDSPPAGGLRHFRLTCTHEVCTVSPT